jgi:hypothetical protein
MNIKNILSEGTFLQDLFKLKRTGKFKALMRMSKDKNSIRALKDLNDATARLEKLERTKFGNNTKLHRYKLIDFFI